MYYFAYADTIQGQALYLVAAKVAAALRVNGDTVSNDSGQGAGLAELDNITGIDIVATLARIVTGDAELNTRSLQQAFAEANASLRQANTIIGAYEIVAGEPESEILTRDETQAMIDATLSHQANPRQTLTGDMTSASPVEPPDVFERVQRAVIVGDPAPAGQQQSLFFNDHVINRHTANGRAANGNASTISTAANGRSQNRLQPNGNGRLQKNGHKSKDEAEEKPLAPVKMLEPPVPRPRLLI